MKRQHGVLVTAALTAVVLWTATAGARAETRRLTRAFDRGLEVSIRQRAFGIEPITVAGGTVKVEDELKIQFEIAR
jgi:hypothetical protein